MVVTRILNGPCKVVFEYPKYDKNPLSKDYAISLTNSVVAQECKFAQRVRGKE